VTGVDIRDTGDIVADNRSLPLPDDSHDVGVIDPPYKRGAGNRIFEKAYGKAPCTYRRMMTQYYEAIPELLRVVRCGIVAKVQDGCEAERLYANHIELANWMRLHYGLALADLAVLVASGRRPAHTHGQRRRFQQTLSYFLVWKWPNGKKPKAQNGLGGDL
jgi:hypothetical protein